MLVGRCLTRWLTRFRWRRIGRLTSGMDTGSRTVITDLHDRDAGTSPPPPPLLHSVRMKIIIFTHSNDRARHGYVRPSMPIVYHLQCCWFNDYSFKYKIVVQYIVYFLNSNLETLPFSSEFSVCRMWLSGGRKSIYQLSGFGGRGGGSSLIW